MAMTSSRPYLVRALYDWIVDNGMTPHLVVDAQAEGVLVPQEYVRDGQITLNIAPSAVGTFNMSLEAIEFSARFRSIPCDLYVPCMAVLGVYARENGQGMMFAPDDGSAPPPTGGGGDGPKTGGSGSGGDRPNLRVVK